MCNGNCGGGCNSCNQGCHDCGGNNGCYPIINVNCLPTIGRTTSKFFYRTPDDKLYYVNSACNAYIELTSSKERESNIDNIIIDLTNRMIESEKALGLKPSVPTKFTSKPLTGQATHVVEHNLDTATPLVVITRNTGQAVEVVTDATIVVTDNNTLTITGKEDDTLTVTVKAI